MALAWSPWIVLDAENVEQLGPRSTGLYEVKVERRIVQYPTGKSAMIYYGCTNDEVLTLRDALERDWFAEDKEEVRSQWAEYGDLVWRFALQDAPQPGTPNSNPEIESEYWYSHTPLRL